MRPNRPAAVLLSLCLVLAAPGLARGQTRPSQAKTPRAGIPKQPSTPPQLAPETPTAEFTCQRRMLWQGKSLPCDSDLFRDGENLRPILSAVPEAEAKLDEYQRARTGVRKLTYVGATGMALLAGSFVAPGLFNDRRVGDRVGLAMLGTGVLVTAGSLFYSLGALQPGGSRTGTQLVLTGLGMTLAGLLLPAEAGGTRNPLRTMLLGGGVLVTTGSAFYGLGTFRRTEAKLGEAVHLYNQARPETPIELQFTTGFTF
jgi:hypothetical protein